MEGQAMNSTIYNRIIFLDVDGVLADCTHRLHYIEQSPKDYDKFYSDEEISKDKALQKRDFISNIEGYVVFLTTRPIRTRPALISWLCDHYDLPVGGCTFLMREDGDHRKSPEVKAELALDFMKHPPIGTGPAVAEWAMIDDMPENLNAVGRALINYPCVGVWH